MFKFEIVHRSKKSGARVGRMYTPHGVIETPHFVPVATQAALKSVDSSIVNEMDVQLMFCNTYHLILHPGPEVIEQAGGIHTFMGRRQPIITDSGGFQVFSLAYGGVYDELKSRGQKTGAASVLKISEEGVLFRSYRDGSPIMLTPESSVQAQKKIGADIIIPLDELPPYHVSPERLRRSLDRTHRWEKRSLDEHIKDRRNQAMFAVVHGGIDPELRRISAQFVSSLPFDGYGIGGSLGKNHQEMGEMLMQLIPHLPEQAPRHLLGMGDLDSFARAIPLGIDTFDSSHPSRCARHAALFTRYGVMKIIQSRYKTVFRPIDEQCRCLTCKNYTQAYVHHLFKAHEAIGLTLATIHNLQFMMDLMRDYRQKIMHDEI